MQMLTLVILGIGLLVCSACGQERLRALYSPAKLSTKSYAELCQGNFRCLDEAVANQDLGFLYYTFKSARADLFGDIFAFEETDAAKLCRKELNRRILQEAKRRLPLIEGYVANLVQKLDAATGERLMLECEGYLIQLADLGGWEAIQGIAKYLDDPRKAPEIPDGPSPCFQWASLDVWVRAAECLHQALGPDSPIKYAQLKAGDHERIRAWWKSEAAKPYRDWKAGNSDPFSPAK